MRHWLVRALQVGVFVIVGAAYWTHSWTKGCDPSTSGFCECSSYHDCIDTKNPLMAGVCNAGNTCSNRFSPWVPQVTGGVHRFCDAYVDGCRPASLTLVKQGERVEVSIEGPGSLEAAECSLQARLGDTRVVSGTAGRIADSVEACVHNAPVYFYETMKAALDGSMFCCGYDWSYRPPRTARR